MNIRLRALEPEDLDMLYRIENDPALWDAGVTNVPYSRYTLHQYIADSAGDIYADKQVRLMVENERGEVVGVSDLTNFDPRHLRAEVGIVILSEHRRQGYATAVLHELEKYAAQMLHLHQLYAVIDQRNAASNALFQQAGWLSATTLNDWLFDGSHFHHATLYQKILT